MLNYLHCDEFLITVQVVEHSISFAYSIYNICSSVNYVKTILVLIKISYFYARVHFYINTPANN